MKQISRHEAENLFQEFEILSSKVESDASGLKILLQFSEQETCVVHYSHVDGAKKYYLDRL